MCQQNRIALVALVLGCACPSAFGADRPGVTFATFFGGSGWEHARGACSDPDGNFYVVGGTASKDFPTSREAFQREFQAGGKDTGPAGDCDAFVIKFGAKGEFVWATLLGGPNYDRAYGVRVAPDGSVLVCGRAGDGFPTTKRAFQPTYAGSRSNSLYGGQCGFVANLSADGKKLRWSSYVGVGECCRSLDVDADGNVYTHLFWTAGSASVPKPDWFKTAFRKAFQDRPQGDLDTGAIKISPDGTRVLWATWLGGSGKDSGEASVRVNGKGELTLASQTESADFPTAGAAANARHAGGMDAYVARFSGDGSKLTMCTLIGSKQDDWVTNTHNLAIDGLGNSYLAIITPSGDFPTSRGAFNNKHSGKGDLAVVKVGPDGKLLASTFVGGSGADNPDGIEVDAKGNVYVVGETDSPDFPTTPAGTQPKSGGKQDGFAVVLDADLTKLVWSTYSGGSGNDRFRACCLTRRGELCAVGSSSDSVWPTFRAHQAKNRGGPKADGENDAIVSVFNTIAP